MDNNFITKGFTDIICVNFNDELINLQKIIYGKTKDYLIEHEQNLPIEKKINLQFKKIPSDELWSQLMKTVNESEALKNIINSDGIKKAFKIIFKNPKPFDISTFRARFPNQKRVMYNWHQDEGTWYLSKNTKHLNKFPATLWLSLNGANKNDSIQLVNHSHKKKLYDHQFITGQGFFNIKNKKMIKGEEIYTVETKASECVIFHPLTMHRSVPSKKLSLRPRYTIDVRYYDDEFKPQINVDWNFKIKKIFKKLF